MGLCHGSLSVFVCEGLMYTINVLIIDNVLLNVALGVLALTAVIRVVRWVLDILP